jgi:multidrug efflux pump subunit AcrA (membrane-fusion protein)
VKVGIDSAQSVFKPEMLVDVTFLAPKAVTTDTEIVEKTRLYLPQTLVLRDDGGTYVWLADQSQGIVRKTVVATGRPLAGGLVEVAEGLSVGSRVVSRGHENLSDGQRIRVVSEEPETSAALPSDSASHSMGSVVEEGH